MNTKGKHILFDGIQTGTLSLQVVLKVANFLKETVFFFFKLTRKNCKIYFVNE